MKGTVNRVMLVGRLGNDPDVRATASGNQVATISVATNDRERDQNGNWVDSTDWHRCVAFGKTAEIIAQYLRKGSSVYIEGKTKTRKWQDQNGQDRYTTEIIVREMTMLGGNESAGGNPNSAPQQRPPQQPAQQGYQNQPNPTYQQPAPQGQQQQPNGAPPVDDWDAPPF